MGEGAKRERQTLRLLCECVMCIQVDECVPEKGTACLSLLLSYHPETGCLAKVEVHWSFVFVLFLSLFSVCLLACLFC